MEPDTQCCKCWCGAPAFFEASRNWVEEEDGFIVKCKRRHYGGWAKTVTGAKASWDKIVEKRNLRIYTRKLGLNNE